MYLVRVHTAALFLVVAVLATIDIRRGGWLDRVVQYNRERFINDVQKIAPVKINATIIPAPPGYTDSNHWDFESVLHLLVLIGESKAAAPVHRALRRAMKPSRRLMMSMADSFKHFPSLSKYAMNDFYYDVGSAEDYPESPQPVEKGVIIVSNPVEARLPSAQISISLLKDILIARALAAREMPSTTKSTIPWKPMNKTTTPAPAGNGDDDKNGAEDGKPEDGAKAAEDAKAEGGAAAGADPAADPGAEPGPAAEGAATTEAGATGGGSGSPTDTTEPVTTSEPAT